MIKVSYQVSNLVSIKSGQVVTTSLQVASAFSKDHRHVLRDIDNLKQDVPNFGRIFQEVNDPDSYGCDTPSFHRIWRKLYNLTPFTRI
ncbi:Rha family transcriptional regulator [Lacticaseibacillus paracasei]|nr:Rha family transcriptional regulator [Lacticaseibacillus paracasei]MBM6413788.1 Rha family transcriptional regulator [Lacticaseibacillus paracasei]